ncbi:hypothetical protein RLIN73S_02482 [Rhodanobacter lindaniclasticus]
MAQHAAGLARGGERGGHRCVEFVQSLEERLARQGGHRCGHQALQIHLLQRQRPARLARQDHQLACRIKAGEVVARIGLGIAQRVRLAHQRGEWKLAVMTIAQPGQRAGEHAFCREQFVAGVEQVAQGLHHRQAGADGGLAAEARAFGAGGADRLPAIQRAAAGQLVRCHHVQARGEPARVVRGDLVAGAAVDQQRVAAVVAAHVCGERVQIVRPPDLRAVAAVELGIVAVQPHALAGHHAAQAQIQGPGCAAVAAGPRAVVPAAPYRPGRGRSRRRRAGADASRRWRAAAAAATEGAGLARVHR